MVVHNEYRSLEEIVRVARFVANQSLVRQSDGNISIRMDQDRLLASTSGHNKMSMEPDDPIIVNKVVDPSLLPGYELDRLW